MNDFYYELGKCVQENAKDEASAIANYTILLDKIVSNNNINQEIKNRAINTITEIIADELNHQNVLSKLYELLTEIDAKKD